jgi:hypothetical protein
MLLEMKKELTTTERIEITDSTLVFFGPGTSL